MCKIRQLIGSHIEKTKSQEKRLFGVLENDLNKGINNKSSLNKTVELIIKKRIERKEAELLLEELQS